VQLAAIAHVFKVDSMPRGVVFARCCSDDKCPLFGASTLALAHFATLAQ
jgi:hypothetical protein